MNIRLNFPAAAAVAALLLAGCGTLGMGRPEAKDPGADRALADLNALQADQDLASRAPAAIKDAQDAVDAAEVPQSDPLLANHLAYLAQRKVQTARALAEARLAEDRLNGARAQQAQPATVSTGPNGTPLLQLPPGQSLPLPQNPGVPTVQTGAGTVPVVPAAPPAPAPKVTVPPMTPAYSTPNAPVVPLPQQTAPAQAPPGN
jgi:hypothetical protein